MRIVDAAAKRRYLHLLQKVKAGEVLKPKEVKELEGYEMANKKQKPKQSNDKEYCRTQALAAEFAKVNVRTLRRWQAEGLSRDVARGYLKQELKAWAQAGGKPTMQKHRKEKAEADYREAKAKLAEIELALKEGKLVEVEILREFMAEQVVAAKRRLLGLGQKLALRLSVISEPTVISAEINAEVEEAIGLLAAEFEQKRDKG